MSRRNLPDQGHLDRYMTLSGANAAASASAQGDNVKMTEIIGDGPNLIRDVSWRHVTCATMYNNLVLEFARGQEDQAN
jgi:hypothetical protein